MFIFHFRFLNLFQTDAHDLTIFVLIDGRGTKNVSYFLPLFSLVLFHSI